jgi:hypothetical protein
MYLQGLRTLTLTKVYVVSMPTTKSLKNSMNLEKENREEEEMKVERGKQKQVAERKRHRKYFLFIIQTV